MKREERDRMARAMARPAVVVGRAAPLQAPAPAPEVQLVEKVGTAEKIACAYCGSRKSHVVRTQGRIRYRRCDGGCGRSFVEVGVSRRLKE